MGASVALVGRARVFLALLVAALACAGGASAASGWTEVTITASDATPLACAYIIPSGTAPAGGWPGVILFHGLGQSRADMEAYGNVLVQFGIASLACDARGTGASGGKFGLDGARDVQDARDLFNWFAGRDDVSKYFLEWFGPTGYMRKMSMTLDADKLTEPIDFLKGLGFGDVSIADQFSTRRIEFRPICAMRGMSSSAGAMVAARSGYCW